MAFTPPFRIAGALGIDERGDEDCGGGHGGRRESGQEPSG
jgi:hypothetical protein